MARKPGDPQLTHTGKWWRLRFTHEGTRHDFKTAVIPADDLARATRWKADRLDWVYSGQWKNEVQTGNDPTAKLSEVAAAYLAEKSGGEITERTANLRKIHLRVHLLPRFKRLCDVTRGALASYQSERLKRVRYSTVQKELSTLMQVLKFAEIKSWIGQIPRFPDRPHKSLGTKAKQAPSGWTKGFTAATARQLIPHLPDLCRKNRKSGEQWPLRPYFALMFETALRPGFWDGFRVGTHWHPGQRHLDVTEDVDKNRWERKVPLSPHACELLEGCYHAEIHRLGQLRNGGQLVRTLDYRTSLRQAARAAGIPEHIASRVKAYDMRHARTTELMDQSGGRTLGVGFLVGHKQASTTNRYSHADEKQAAEVVDLVSGNSGGDTGGGVEKRVFGVCAGRPKVAVFLQCEGEDSNLHGSYPTSTSRVRFRLQLLGFSEFSPRGDSLEHANTGHSGIRTQYLAPLRGLVKTAHRLKVIPGQKWGITACSRGAQ